MVVTVVMEMGSPCALVPRSHCLLVSGGLTFSPWSQGTGWWSNSVLVPRYRVVVSYPPQSEAELELKEGDVVFVHRKREDGWFKGTLQRNGRTGLFPGSFVDSV